MHLHNNQKYFSTHKGSYKPASYDRRDGMGIMCIFFNSNTKYWPLWIKVYMIYAILCESPANHLVFIRGCHVVKVPQKYTMPHFFVLTDSAELCRNINNELPNKQFTIHNKKMNTCIQIWVAVCETGIQIKPMEDLYRQVVFIYKRSLNQVGLYSHSHNTNQFPSEITYLMLQGRFLARLQHRISSSLWSCFLQMSQPVQGEHSVLCSKVSSSWHSTRQWTW